MSRSCQGGHMFSWVFLFTFFFLLLCGRRMLLVNFIRDELGRVLCNYLWPWPRTSLASCVSDSIRYPCIRNTSWNTACGMHFCFLCVQCMFLNSMCSQVFCHRNKNQASDLELVFLCSEIYLEKYYLTASRVLQVQVSLLKRTKYIF